MARPIQIIFPAPDSEYLLANADGNGGGVIPLTPPLSYPVIFPNIARTISFYSGDDLSESTFTIIGTDEFGNVISETKAGPDNAIIESSLQYHSVTSILIDQNYTDLSIGTGNHGRIQWVKLNTLSTVGYWTLQTQVTPTVDYSFYGTTEILEKYEMQGGAVTYKFPAAPTLLGDDPILTHAGSSLLTVTIPPNYSLKTGDRVLMQGSTGIDTLVAGQINIRTSVSVLSPTSFLYSATANATNAVQGGGQAVSYTFPPPPAEVAFFANQTTDHVFTSNEADVGQFSALQIRINTIGASGSLVMNLIQQGIK